MHADEHAGAMNVCMTIVRPGLFFQREGPGSEPGNSLLCPDETLPKLTGTADTPCSERSVNTFQASVF